MKSFWFKLGVVGAAGGFVSWVFSMTIGTPMRVTPLVALGASVIFGITAAFFGFFLANTAQQPMARAMLFALVCGFCWQPLLDAAQAYVKQLPQAKLEGRAEQQARELSQAIKPMADPTVGAEARQEAARRALVAAQALVGTASQIKDIDTRLRFEISVLAAQDVIRNSNVPPTQVMAQAAAKLATTAATAGFGTVAMKALTALHAQQDAQVPPTGLAPTDLDRIVRGTQDSVMAIARERSDKTLEMAIAGEQRSRNLELAIANLPHGRNPA